MTSQKTPGDSYSSAERRVVAPLRAAWARAVGPVVRALAAVGVTANLVSVSQVAVGAASALAMPSSPRLALLLFFLALLLDTLDGALARTTGTASPFGMLVDQYSDHAREIIIIGGLVYAAALSPLLAIAYALVYPATNLTIALCNHHGAPLRLALKTYLVTYPAIICYLLLDVNWLDAGVSVSLTFMLITIGAGLWELRKALSPPAAAR